MLAMTITALRADYRSGHRSVREVVQDCLSRIHADHDRNIWISTLDETLLETYLQTLEASDPESLPLYGIPFAIKDNIDLAGIPTTAGCPEYAYTPQESAFVVECLLKAGAIPLGKTNLDQFATGLVGVRSPYGVCANAFDPSLIAGGSSSGSAVAVARGHVSFALGTDTAGSGRVPAAFNNLIGIKPTRGLFSARGVVPACRSLDSVSIFALDTQDAAQVFSSLAIYDANDAYARPDTPPAFGQVHIPLTGMRCGIPAPDQCSFFGTHGPAYREQFSLAVQSVQDLGGTCVEIDFIPFLDAAQLLYAGPWVAERYAAIQDFIEQNPEALFPVTRDIIGGGRELSAVDTFLAQYQLQALRQATQAIWQKVDCIMTPTAGGLPSIAEVEADPVGINTALGYYTNFMNLLDLAAVAVPAGKCAAGIPFGVTLLAPSFTDRTLWPLANGLQHQLSLHLGTSPDPLPATKTLQNTASPHGIALAVCGAHMQGLALNHELTRRRARLLKTTSTAPDYRLYALPGGPPERPGLVRVATGGAAIEVEVWLVPVDQLGGFIAAIPSPLGIGQIRLSDGSQVCGFLCEAIGVAQARDITHLGSWRRYLATEMA